MPQTLDLTPDSLRATSPGLINRTAVLTYGVSAYAVGVTGLLWIILALGGFAPVSFSPLHTQTTMAALLVNFGVIGLFGMQHSIMARPAFKRLLIRWIPAAAERSTFVLLSGVFMILAIAFWQPLPGEVWSVSGTTGKVALWSLYTLGWTYLFAATFVTNHFELMGLRQVYLYFIRQPYTSLPFVRKYMYRYSRHPMMLGVLAGMWSIPVMSVSHFVMAALMTLYIAIGVTLEERDLLEQFGDAYRSYKKEIATLIPHMF